MDGSSTSLDPDWNDIRTVTFFASNGSTNVPLRWNYTLGTGELVVSKTWSLDRTQIAIAGAITILNDNRFDVNKSEVATLIMKNVSELKDTTIKFVVQTSLGSWTLHVRTACQILRMAHFERCIYLSRSWQSYCIWVSDGFCFEKPTTRVYPSKHAR